MKLARRFFPTLLICAWLHSATVSQVADAAKRLDKAAVRAMLDAKADVNAPSPDGTTALHWAVRADDMEIAGMLLGAGANPNAADRYGVSALNLAILNNHQPMIRALLKAGANPNLAGEGGETPLMTAARTGNTETMKALLERGAAVNVCDRLTGQTALMWAVRGNHSYAVELLLAHGAEVNAQTKIGPTPPRRVPNAGGGSHGLGIDRGGTPPRGSLETASGGLSALHYAAR
ncbi:MAG: ankyrin repeat domain-containing protein, partial [Acidobacteriia bacterium]|nr:ankyrin repeat domain-containing protein [Terriglobia bacterium]